MRRDDHFTICENDKNITGLITKKIVNGNDNFCIAYSWGKTTYHFIIAFCLVIVDELNKAKIPQPPPAICLVYNKTKRFCNYNFPCSFLCQYSNKISMEFYQTLGKNFSKAH